MSAAATSPGPRRHPTHKGEHIHLPSVHYRHEDGTFTGFDYEEDYYVTGRGRKQRVHRVVRLTAIVGGVKVLRETRDFLCPEEVEQLREDLPILMDEGNPAATALMQEAAQKELARQTRIDKGEAVCLACGCSETRGCSGGCFWATATICSRCA